MIQCREKEGRANTVISSEFSDSSLQGDQAELKGKTDMGLLQVLSASFIDILFSQELMKCRSQQKGLYVLAQF